MSAPSSPTATPPRARSSRTVRRGPAPGHVALPGRLAQPRSSTAYARPQRERGRRGPRLVVRLLGALPERPLRRAGRVPRDPGELRPGARASCSGDNVRLLRVAGQLQPAAEGLPEHPADVPRRLLHAVHAARQRRRSRAGTSTSRRSTGTSSPATTSTRCSTSTRATSGCSSPSRSPPASCCRPGEYRFTRFRSSLFATAAKRRLSGSFDSWRAATYWSGRPSRSTPSVTFKLPPWFTVEPERRTRRSRSLPEGHFTARSSRRTLELQRRRPACPSSNLVQYDNRSRNLGWQSRMRWTLQPGNDFFFVVQPGLDPRGGRISASTPTTGSSRPSSSTRSASDARLDAPFRPRPAPRRRSDDRAAPWRGSRVVGSIPTLPPTGPVHRREPARRPSIARSRWRRRGTWAAEDDAGRQPGHGCPIVRASVSERGHRGGRWYRRQERGVGVVVHPTPWHAGCPVCPRRQALSIFPVRAS